MLQLKQLHLIKLYKQILFLFQINGGTNDINQIGFIAQNVQSVFPQLVIETDGIKSVNYAQMSAVLLEAIKEQNLIIKQLQSDVEILKNKNKN